MMISRIDTSAALGVDEIAKSILVLRDQNVLLDRDLAALYGVTTKRLNEQVKRKLARFPIDFMFQLTAEEETALRSHFATSKKPAANRGGRRYSPYAFTEQGVAMPSSVLSTKRAVAVNIEIMRAFVRMRSVLAAKQGTRATFCRTREPVRQENRGTGQSYSRNNVRDPGADESAHPTHARYWLHRQVRRIATAAQRKCAHHDR
jgi:hypothetical protein